MTTDRVLATLAMLCLIAFLSVLVIWVPRWDLGIVIGVSVLLAAYDFYHDLKPRERRG